MITAEGQVRTEKGRAEFYGLSTDQKPVDSTVGNGSSFIEMDTGTIYFYNEESGVWLRFGG